MLSGLMQAALSALLGALGKAAVYLYDRLYGDAAKWRVMREWQVRQHARLESERDRLKAATEAIDRAPPPDDVAKGLTDAWNQKPKP